MHRTIKTRFAGFAFPQGLRMPHRLARLDSTNVALVMGALLVLVTVSVRWSEAV